MTDTIKEETKEKLPELKPGHARLPKGKRVFERNRVYKDQAPEALVAKALTGTGNNGTSSAPALSKPSGPAIGKEPGGSKPSGSAVKDSNK